MKKVIIATALLAVLIAAIAASGCLRAKCGADTDCELSLCDCKCYGKGKTPEATTGEICGIDCATQYGVYGCECSGQMCIEKTAA